MISIDLTKNYAFNASKILLLNHAQLRIFHFILKVRAFIVYYSNVAYFKMLAEQGRRYS